MGWGVVILCVAAGCFSAAPAAAATRAYTASDGDTVQISGFHDVAPEYAEFLSALPHGPELAALKVRIVAAEEIPPICGDERMSACYLVGESTIVVPGPVLDGPLVAHEYGHHIATHRQAGGSFSSRSVPAHWSSRARICSMLRLGRIGSDWTSDPVEAWAEVYVRLVYPRLPWRLSPALKPTAGELAAAWRDVTGRLPRQRVRTFRGRFGEAGSSVRRFSVPARLDGPVELVLEAERAMKLELELRAGGHRMRARPGRTLRHDLCRTGRERVVVHVRREAGTGPFAVRARYRG